MTHLAIKEGSTLIQKELRTLAGHSRIKMDIFDPHLTFQMHLLQQTKQRSHPMQLRSAKVQEVSLNEINIGDLLQKQQHDTVGYHSRIYV